MPDYYRTNDDGSTDYYDARAGLYYPEDESQEYEPNREELAIEATYVDYEERWA